MCRPAISGIDDYSGSLWGEGQNNQRGGIIIINRADAQGRFPDRGPHIYGPIIRNSQDWLATWRVTTSERIDLWLEFPTWFLC